MKSRSASRPDAAEGWRNADGSQPAAQMKPTAAAVMPDARAASLAQLRQQEQAGNSPQAAQLKAHAELMAGGGADAAVQRVEDDELLQEKFETVQRQGKPNDTGLPDQLKSGIESLSGMSMDHVKVHYNSDKPAQLQAHAYAQGSEIHVAPGQEQHVPHEAWHVVQQAQGRVRPTLQMKGRIGVNDDAELEREADLMGAQALGASPVQMRKKDKVAMSEPTAFSFHSSVQRASSSGAVVQRFLGENGYSLPNGERDIDGFLAENGFAAPYACTAADWATLTAQHATLLGLIGANDEVDLESVGGVAYQALVDAATEMELIAGNAGWGTAVTAGADAFELNPGAGTVAVKTARAAAAWPGRHGMPAPFPAAVIAEIDGRAAARAAEIVAAYEAYNDGRLNAGTRARVRVALAAGGGANLAAVNARLALVYGRQCTVTRLNWLQHLRIAGEPINGNANCHYTTFNNSVAPEANIAALRVDQNTVDQLCTALFTASTVWQRQLHATVVDGGNRYHKYWDGSYSAGVPAAGAVLDRLDAEFDRMHLEIRNLVISAKAEHGRVSDNSNGGQTPVGP